MTSLQEASEQALKVTENLKALLESQFKSVSYSASEHGYGITCISADDSIFRLSIVPDYDRRNFHKPKSSIEYQKAGGHKDLFRQLERLDPEAWRVEVHRITSDCSFEEHCHVGESNWSEQGFEEMLRDKLGI